ncbi:hypothetical protein [Anaeromyxobacter terrae]|uniref:hypothetical protein n=1 Tax=Anaeromyxobacter terrae TaxID=2925406 RepID=UPI001F568C76|nr:hypothetical protein [Anaeromyxobacter sp. SG22]
MSNDPQKGAAIVRGCHLMSGSAGARNRPRRARGAWFFGTPVADAPALRAPALRIGQT